MQKSLYGQYYSMLNRHKIPRAFLITPAKHAQKFDVIAYNVFFNNISYLPSYVPINNWYRHIFKDLNGYKYALVLFNEQRTQVVKGKITGLEGKLIDMMCKHQNAG